MTLNTSQRRAGAIAGAVLVIGLLTAATGGGDIVVPVMLVASLIAGGIGYGVTKQKADAAHSRIDRHEKTVVTMEEKINKKLDGIAEQVTNLRITIEGGHMHGRGHRTGEPRQSHHTESDQ